MKKRRGQRKERDTQLRAIRLWNQADATLAFPYIRSVAQGLREHWLSATSSDLRARRLSAKPGRPDRNTLMAIEDANGEKNTALNRFEEAIEELNKIDAFCLDPVKGIIWVPFRSGDELAWYVFDTFDQKGLIGWRLHNDAAETLRPMAEPLPKPENPEPYLTA